jgi:hypothetical protein
LILVDFNQVNISNLMMQLGNHTNAQVDENMVRHMIINSIRSYRQKFGHEYGELVIACDSFNYWRKKIFPHYKASRKKAQEASEINWNDIYKCMNKVRQEFKDFMPYPVIDVESAEADDVIGTIVYEYGNYIDAGEKLLILSADKDFIQLHKFANVSQYDPINKKWITHNDPEQYLREHVLRGDAGDGIPNILSDDDCFVIGKRQSSMTQKRLQNFLGTDPSQYDTSAERNYYRNRDLIDLEYIPKEVKDKILESFNRQIEEPRDRSKLMDYFMANKLKNLMETLSEF